MKLAQYCYTFNRWHDYLPQTSKKQYFTQNQIEIQTAETLKTNSQIFPPIIKNSLIIIQPKIPSFVKNTVIIKIVTLSALILFAIVILVVIPLLIKRRKV
jgi:hypothetical protein